METDIKIIDTVDSTNTTLSQMAGNLAPEGTCVVSFCQIKGQGRSGRSFYSPDGGNLYMSLLLRPKSEADTSLITIAAAAATRAAIKTVFGIDTGIKWVNDLILNEKKVCGIIAQAHNIGREDFYVVLGIGVNVYPAADIPEEIADVYGSLFSHMCSLPEDEKKSDAIRLAKEIINRFCGYYEMRDKKRCIEDYRKYSVVTGKDVLYVSGDTVVKAKAVDITDDGEIVLEIDGIRRSYRDGEIRIRLTDKNLAL